MGDHADLKSNASSNFRRGSVSYSQPSSPKGDFSLSPVSSISSLSCSGSTEQFGEYDSESCASLNSVNSSLPSLQSFNSREMTIHESNENDNGNRTDFDNLTPLQLP